MKIFKSIKWRLQIWYGLILVVVLAGFGFTADLLEQFRQDVEQAVLDDRIGYEESGRMLKFYEEGLYGYTYLEDVHES